MILYWRARKEAFELLAQTLKTAHFVVHYANRESGATRHGVHDLALIKTYADSLEKAWKKLEMSRPALVADLPELVHVYVCDERLAGMVERGGSERLLILPAHHELKRWDDVLERAQAEAVHEVMHLFNAVRHAPLDLKSRWWEWLDEGLAVFAEAWVCPANTDYYIYALDWRDYPEKPLDDARARYQTRMFVAYLAARFGVEWLFQVWDEAKETTPFEAFKQALPGVSWEQVFADYMREAYDLSEPSSRLYAPATHQRFDKRLLMANVKVSAGEPWRGEFQLDHLAGRYFRLAWTAGETLTLRLGEATRQGATLRAEVWAAGMDVLALQPDGEGALVIELPQSDYSAEEVILIVTNAGTRAQRANVDYAHDDQRRFTLEASVR